MTQRQFWNGLNDAMILLTLFFVSVMIILPIYLFNLPRMLIIAWKTRGQD